MCHVHLLGGGGLEGEHTAHCSVVGSAVVFCEDTGAILGAEDYDGVNGEQGHAGRHGCGFGWLHTGVWSICYMDAIKIANVVDSGVGALDVRVLREGG